MFNTMFSRKTLAPILFAALGTLSLSACTQSSAGPPIQAQARTPALRTFDTDPPEIVISAPRTHEAIRK